MAKYLFIINDAGTTWTITSTKVEPDNNFIVNPDLYYETPSPDFHLFIKDLLLENMVSYLKNFDHAKLLIESTADDSDIIFQAIAPGAPGDNVGIVLAADVADQTLQVDLSGGIITVTLATDGDSVITSTATDIATAVAAYAPAASVVNAILRGTGTGVVDALPETYLSGGEAGEDELTEEDIMTIPYDELVIAKSRARTRGKYLLNQRIDTLMIFDFFEYSLTNNVLIDAGYVITDENREEKYLEIINTGDEDLIASLETYLEVRDRIGEHLSWYNSYITFKDDVNTCADTDCIDDLYNEFASAFI